MKVLITGGYGFIGSAVAERFHKEGHEIYIIDNLSTGRKEHVTVPHKAYVIDVADPNCDEIFAGASFDIVVHLAAQVDVAASMNEPSADTRANILGLVNILDCASKHKVKKLIFASSAAVYGDADRVPLKEEDLADIQSMYGMNKRLGELYCEKWGQFYGLETIIFRFANVYGPKQGNGGEGGVVSIFLQAALRGQPIAIYGDGEQTRDFIYVGDIADAIWRGATTSATGVMNLSTCRETSVNELLNTLRAIHPEPLPKPEYRSRRSGDIERSCLDNMRAKKSLDWVPLYTIGEGLAATYEWAAAKLEASAAAAPSVKPKRSLLRPFLKLRGYTENVLLFAALVAYLNVQSSSTTGTSLDLFLVYILVMGLFYGTRQSAPATAAVIVYLFVDSLRTGWYWGNVITDTHFLFQSALYLFFGLAVGFVRDRHLREKLSQEDELKLKEQRYDFLMNIYQDTRDVKESLQKQVLTSKDSLGRLHTIVSELESLEPERIVMTSVNVLEELMETKRISIYAVAGGNDFIRLMAQSSDDAFQVPRSINLSEAPELRGAITSGKLFVNKGLLPNAPAMAAPVVSSGETTAIICIHELAFDRFTLYYENLFRIAVDLISRSLSRSFRYIQLTRSERFVEDTAILQEQPFLEVVQSKRAAKERNQTEYVLLAVEGAEGELSEIAPQLTGSLRSTDYIGLLGRQLAILLSSTSSEEVKFAVSRLERRGFRTRVLEEGELHA